MTVVTVPGSGAPGTQPPITLSSSAGENSDLAQAIAALLATLPGGTNLTTTAGAVSGAPTTPEGATQILQLTSSASIDVQTAGYEYVYDTGGQATTVTGSNVTILSGDGGGLFNISDSTVAGTTGNNTVVGTNGYLIQTGDGNSVVFANGSGVVSTAGSNIVVSNPTAGGNVIYSSGTDLIVAASGATTINASGDGSGILGGASGSITADVTANAVTISSAGTDLAATVSGNNAVIFGGSGTTTLDLTGSNGTLAAADTLAGGSGAETVDASGGSSRSYYFGGTGPLSFVGGAGMATIVGAPTGTEAVTVGSGGLVFSAYLTDNASTITAGSGSGGSTIFGGADSDVTYNTSSTAAGAALFNAGAGNETLDAGGSSTNNNFFAGTGSETITGGSGDNWFVFNATLTGGAADIITDYHAGDKLALVGYDTTQSAASVLGNATVSGAGVTLALSDNTKITFTDLSSTDLLKNSILYGPNPTNPV